MTQPSRFAASSGPVVPSSEADDPIPLSRVAIGWRRVVVTVDGPDREELGREGVLPGCVVVVAARTPLGGPVVVELGRARVALSAAVAAQVMTRAFVDDGPG